MRIVLSGYYGFDNVGDEAILFAIIEQLRMIDPQVEINVLSNNPEKTKKTYHVNAVHRRKFWQVIEALKNTDGLISGGGSLLQDKTGMLTIPYYAGIIKMAKFFRKPVFVYAQGMGPIKSALNKWIVKHALNQVEQITVRDKASRQLLSEIGIKQEISIVPDPVVGLDASSYTHQWTITQTFNQKFVTISVRDWSTDHPFTKEIALCLDRVVQNGYAVVFVPMHGEQDERKSKETASLMNEQSYISPVDDSLQSKIALIGESKLLIGMRLHSLIFSAINYTPFIAISYDPKIDAFASLVNQPLAGHVEKSDWDHERLYQLVCTSLVNEEFIREELKEKMTIYQHLAQQTPELALSTFHKQIKCEQSY
ncbi:polysaccharide pyruvyl transferase CsaB [Virgibacillus pantothenticus]|uniref:CsaB protein n=1 Tax=Virgibacillus pantothenticus TaxID=1473 RepID=A0A0L0QSM5_VIRPA|nr:polysaccharide pyruvyl transferase CsaB [Virgibacillus pantothenticus]KNE21591.1 CsaB protein [Virgibacillus pantothenticus]MED3738238.1 polysaccharide pyruvyl transferase CsaB [Virgibacillus pantothenticus]QTY15983.1 polysaccharide pyruvyl transferase CsaB [Virgibacillus pantothenticus]SIS73904.1 polysaccharide pyruvyl transferase CsaB [Virgibacillus pantothenticus]GIP63606.1 polysaccharide pyruvyl transferase CsaB [Virgibacillus pantothenticus]